MIIAIDGPAGSGKGTIAKAVAQHFRLPHLDTGLLYRAVGLKAEPYADGPEFEPRAVEAAKDLDPQKLDDPALLSARAGEMASRAGAIGPVRAALFDFQRQFAIQPGGAVLDGRDIGTVVCPEADVKLFVVASADVRARRRAEQLRALGQIVDAVELQSQLEARDWRDVSAPHGGFRQAVDAHLLDTSQLDIEAAIHAAVGIVESYRARKAGQV